MPSFYFEHFFPQRDLKIKHLNREQFNQQAGEVLTALQKLGEKLSAEEEQFLSQLSVSVSLESAMDKMGALSSITVFHADSSDDLCVAFSCARVNNSLIGLSSSLDLTGDQQQRTLLSAASTQIQQAET